VGHDQCFLLPTFEVLLREPLLPLVPVPAILKFYQFRCKPIFKNYDRTCCPVQYLVLHFLKFLCFQFLQERKKIQSWSGLKIRSSSTNLHTTQDPGSYKYHHCTAKHKYGHLKKEVSLVATFKKNIYACLRSWVLGERKLLLKRFAHQLQFRFQWVADSRSQ
jgi:hypothetical protein